jgi:hypothetical protein
VFYLSVAYVVGMTRRRLIVLVGAAFLVVGAAWWAFRPRLYITMEQYGAIRGVTLEEACAILGGRPGLYTDPAPYKPFPPFSGNSIAQPGHITYEWFADSQPAYVLNGDVMHEAVIIRVNVDAQGRTGNTSYQKVFYVDRSLLGKVRCWLAGIAKGLGF